MNRDLKTLDANIQKAVDDLMAISPENSGPWITQEEVIAELMAERHRLISEQKKLNNQI